jgi:hypothetical protein
MSRFGAASYFNTSADTQPSYKQALLSVLQQQQKPGMSSEEWLNSALNPTSHDE